MSASIFRDYIFPAVAIPWMAFVTNMIYETKQSVALINQKIGLTQHVSCFVKNDH